MGKDTRLVNIYIKIHNKRNLTIEDLNYLFKYDPECFEKTCKNVVYNVPDAKEVLQPKPTQGGETEGQAAGGQGLGRFGQEGQASWGKREVQELQQKQQASQGNEGIQELQQVGQELQASQELERTQRTGQEPGGIQESQEAEGKKDLFATEEVDKERIEAALSNLKQIEQEGLPVGEVDVDTVKSLLGNLYMEMLFPHNGKARFFNMEDQEYRSVFNKKA